jgi:hypothetical protein
MPRSRAYASARAAEAQLSPLTTTTTFSGRLGHHPGSRVLAGLGQGGWQGITR